MQNTNSIHRDRHAATRRRGGFTLVELLIVVGLLLLLAVMRPQQQQPDPPTLIGTFNLLSARFRTHTHSAILYCSSHAMD